MLCDLYTHIHIHNIGHTAYSTYGYSGGHQDNMKHFSREAAHLHSMHSSEIQAWGWGQGNVFVWAVMCLCCSVWGGCVNSVSSYLNDGYLSSLSLSMAHLSLTALHPLILLSHFLFVKLAQALHLSRGVQIQLVCVILCCLVLFSDGHSGRESIWAHTCLNTHLHTPDVPRLALFIQSITILPTSHWAGPYCVLLFHPGAPSKCLEMAFTLMTNDIQPENATGQKG